MATIVSAVVPIPEAYKPYWNVEMVTQVIFSYHEHVIFVLPANKRSEGLELQNGGRNGNAVTYYFKGSGTQGFKVMKGHTVVQEGVLTI